MARLCALCAAMLALLVGSMAGADPLVAEVLRVERDARALLGQLTHEPLARRCVQRCVRQAAPLARKARGVKPGPRRWQETVGLTRVYVQAVILRQELVSCRALIGLRASSRPGKTRVVLEVDRSIPLSDPTEL